MSRTNLKRYLLLLGTIGLVAIAAGSSGTFASFNAEVTNSGNSFATGTLILNDNGGTNTCTSAITGTNNQNSSGSNCDTLFSTPSYIQAPRAVLSAALTTGVGATTSLAFSAGLANAGIDTGDTLTVTDPSNTCAPQTFTSTQSVPAGTALASQSVSVTAATACAFPIGSIVTDSNATYYADLTLTNAGSLNASDIEFESSSHNCTDTAQEPTGTLSSTLSTSGAITHLPVGTSITGGVPGGFANGDPIVITDGGSNTQTFIVNGAQTASTINGLGYVVVQSQTPNFAYTSGTAIGGPSNFSGSVSDLCSHFQLSIQEMTDNTFATTQSDCAYPSVTGTACALSSGTTLHDLPNSFTALTLANPTFTHGSSDYFRLALKLPVSSLTNADQNKATPTFGLTWHIDQA